MSVTVGGINHGKRQSKRKKEKHKNWLRNRTELNHENMRRAKINCNKVIAQKKKKKKKEKRKKKKKEREREKKKKKKKKEEEEENVIGKITTQKNN